MDPIPPTADALEELDNIGETSARAELTAMAERVVALIPSAVGLSLTLLSDNITLTMAASNLETKILDAVQYLHGGPCMTAVAENAVVDLDPEHVLDEERWGLYARASAVHGVQSSLSLPIVDPHGVVTGGVNLYASTPRAFEGHHDQVARFVRAWAPGAVTNADLTFSTRLAAAQAPTALAELSDLDYAAGIVAARNNIEIDLAQQHVADAAAQAGTSVLDLARTIIRIEEARPDQNS